jgi:hypothetical protein
MISKLKQNKPYFLLAIILLILILLSDMSRRVLSFNENASGHSFDEELVAVEIPHLSVKTDTQLKAFIKKFDLSKNESAQSNDKNKGIDPSSLAGTQIDNFNIQLKGIIASESELYAILYMLDTTTQESKMMKVRSSEKFLGYSVQIDSNKALNLITEKDNSVVSFKLYNTINEK